MKVAMIAPPWLPIPPEGYGGIENVLAVLIPALLRQGVEVELFTVNETTIPATKKHYLYEKGQYEFIHLPMYEAVPIPMAHTLFAFAAIKAAGDFDIIHSHNGFVDLLPAAFAESLPPILHTLHGPPFSSDDRLGPGIVDNRPMWRQLGKAMSDSLHIVGISASLTARAPRELNRILMKPVHNGVDPAAFPFVSEKSDYFVTLARAHPDKGQAIAVRLCRKHGYKLRLAGVVASMTKPRQVLMELADPLSRFRSVTDFRYFSDYIFPYLDEHIEYVGDVSGQYKLDFLARAKALLFPIQWDEPFGMAPIEALACGTPVVAMARGALPEIIQHGVNGFLANTEEEFEDYMLRVGEIDPAACRRSVEEKFCANRMAKEYLQRYKSLLRSRNRKPETHRV
jgi:glycosyltransferase involved in cell wall biosynthesis